MKKPNQISNKEALQRNTKIFIKKQFENFGTEEILDENGKPIIKVLFSPLSLNDKFVIKDLITNEVIIIQKKGKFLFQVCQLKNHVGRLIARVIKRRIQKVGSKILLKDAFKNKIYAAIGDFKQYNYKILRVIDQKIIANIENIKDQLILSKKKKFNSNTYYCINYSQNYVEKLKVISFIICIKILTNPSISISGLADFERRIAKLRPIGPRKGLN